MEEASEKLKDNDAYTEEVFGELQAEKNKLSSLQEEYSRMKSRWESEQLAHQASQAKMKELKDEHSVALRSIENTFKDVQLQSMIFFFYLSPIGITLIHLPPQSKTSRRSSRR